MKKFLSILATGLLALTAGNALAAEVITFETIPYFIPNSGYYYTFQDPEGRGYDVYGTISSTGNFSVMSSMLAGSWEYEGRRYSIRNHGASQIPGTDEPAISHMSMPYNQATGRFEFSDPWGCLLRKASSGLGGTSYIIDAYDVSIQYVTDGTTYPPFSKDLLNHKWKVTLTKIDEVKPTYPTYSPDSKGYMNAKSISNSPNVSPYYYTNELNAAYKENNKQIDVVGIDEYQVPVKFDVNLSTGRVKASGFVSETDIAGTWYFCDLEEKDNTLYGTVQNNPDGKSCVIKLDPWGTYCANEGTFGGKPRYEDSTLTLFFTIPGLTDTPSPDRDKDGEIEDPFSASGSGNMTANELKDDGEVYSTTVQGEYAKGLLTVTGMGEGATKPIVFTVNLATGDVASQPGQKYDDTYYYGNVSTKERVVTGRIQNTDDDHCVLTLNPWGAIQNAPGNLTSYYNTKITFDFAIKSLGEANYTPTTTVPTVTPAVELSAGKGEATVESLDKVTLSWGGKSLQLSDQAAIKFDNTTLSSQVKVSNNALEINLADLAKADGTYRLTIPQGAVIIDNKEINTESVLTFNVKANTDGVNIVEADANGIYRVYNLHGVNVMNTGNADELKTLGRGIYIINGKKAVIR